MGFLLFWVFFGILLFLFCFFETVSPCSFGAYLKVSSVDLELTEVLPLPCEF